MSSNASGKILAALLFTFSRQLRERLDFLEGSRQTPLYWGTLQYITEKGMPLPSAIAKYLCITRPSVSSLLTSLERSGYIKRVRDKKDKRAVHIALRPKGAAYLQRGYKQIEREIGVMMESLESQKRKQFVTLLRTIIKYNEQRV